MQLKIWIDWNFCHCKISNVSCSMIERSLRQGKNLRCWVIMAFNFSRSKIDRSPRQGKNLWCWVIMSFIFRWEGWKGHSSDSCCLCAWCLTIDWCVVSPFACLGQESICVVLNWFVAWERVMSLKTNLIASIDELFWFYCSSTTSLYLSWLLVRTDPSTVGDSIQWSCVVSQSLVWRGSLSLSLSLVS